MLIFLFPRLLGPQRLHNIELVREGGGGGRAGGIRELTLDANKLEQVLKYRKASFPESVSTTSVAHYLESINVNCGDSVIYPSSSKIIFSKVTNAWFRVISY